MVKETERTCSICKLSGHNSRTCEAKEKEGIVVKLFGVDLMDNDSIRKSRRIKTKQSLTGYRQSDCHMVSREVQPGSRKGKKWTAEEHQFFLSGLTVLGKGKWNEISKRFVKTRTSTQVATHAQKYYQRLQASDDMKKRTSIFDIPMNQAAQPPQDTEVVTLVETAKTSSKTRNFLDSPQTIDPAQVSNRLSLVCLDDCPKMVPLAMAYPPHYHESQQMLGAPANSKSFQTTMMPHPLFIPGINYMMPSYAPSYAPYGYMPHTIGNFPSSAPVTAYPSGVPSQESFHRNMFLSGPGTCFKA